MVMSSWYFYIITFQPPLRCAVTPFSACTTSGPAWASPSRRRWTRVRTRRGSTSGSPGSWTRGGGPGRHWPSTRTKVYFILFSRLLAEMPLYVFCARHRRHHFLPQNLKRNKKCMHSCTRNTQNSPHFGKKEEERFPVYVGESQTALVLFSRWRQKRDCISFFSPVTLTEEKKIPAKFCFASAALFCAKLLHLRFFLFSLFSSLDSGRSHG